MHVLGRLRDGGSSGGDLDRLAVGAVVNGDSIAVDMHV